MIPLKLSLRNFLCYGEGVPTLDFDGIHVACLCGQNGHGKSALLDAITWALWGKARGKSQDELIHYGNDEMLVDLELLARDTRYRVIRRHARGAARRRQGASDLQLQVDTGADFFPMTGNSIRETQAKIDQIIGMDYDTFINSAFLLQGRADEFTNKTAGERKEVLAKILGLGYYDRLQDRAKERAAQSERASSRIEGELESMRREIARRDGYDTELHTVTGELADVATMLEAARHAYDSLNRQVDNLRRIREELDAERSNISTIEADISDLQVEIETRRARITGHETLIGEKDAIEKGLAQLQVLLERYEELNHVREEYERLIGPRTELQKMVEGAKARLEEQVRQLNMRIDEDLKPRADAAPAIASRLEQAQAHLDELAAEEQRIAEQRHWHQQLAGQLGKYESSASQFKAEGQELRSKLNLILNSSQGAHCPLCGTELGPQGCQRLSASYNAQIEEKLRLYRDNEIAHKSAEEEKLRLDGEIPRREAALRRNQGEAQRDGATLQQQLEESHRSAGEMEQIRQQLAQQVSRLDQETYATEDRGRLAELEAQIAALGYDAKVHRNLYEQMGELRPFEERHRRVEEAIVALPQERDSLARVEQMCRRRAGDLAESMAKVRDIVTEVSELPVWEERLRAAEETFKQHDGSHKGLFRRQAELEAALQMVETLEKEMDDKEASLKSLRAEQGVYQELVEAFGRRGVQAMLIETVLPRIEQEANSLLGRMTDDRMYVKLETQRERRGKKTEPIETLEIKISDELGPRSYELFSGGEAFRINLALRIALSKVLAHRRGAPLPTLFVDEGFGTQDAAGRERILDVIRAIEGDFERIIVITHMDEMKDAFPTRIEVQKEGNSSSFVMS